MTRRLWPVLSILLLASGPATALTDEEVFRNFRFNLINPGGRSLALGGAFIPLADDATAALANPAGMGFLGTNEYFAEVRWVDNAARSTIIEEPLPGGIDSFVGVGTDLDDTVSPTFLAAVFKFGKWTAGFSRHELINVSNATLSSFAFRFANGAFLVEGTGAIDVDVVNYNASVAYRVTDRFSAGATLTYSTLDVRSDVSNFIVDTGGVVAGTEILEPQLDLRTMIDDSADDVVISYGVLYRAERWSIGGVFRLGPTFRVSETVDTAAIGEGGDLFGVTGVYGDRFTNTFSLPDVAGIGASWRPSDRLTLALSVERIWFSNLLESYQEGVNVLTDFDAVFTADDATDVRLGAEYVFLNRNNWLPILALRAGAFSEGDSTIRAESTGTASFASEDAFGGQDDQLHGALGMGINLKRFKVDLAADFSENRNEYVVSVIFQGKR